MMNSVHTQLWPVTAPGKRSKLPGPNIQPSFDRSLNFYGRGAKRTLAAAGTTGKTDSARGDLRNSILLIEHDQETAHLLTLSLQNFGYLVDHAVDGEAGLERIHAARPSIVLCDIAAPRVDGFRISRSCRMQVRDTLLCPSSFLPISETARASLRVAGSELMNV